MRLPIDCLLVAELDRALEFGELLPVALLAALRARRHDDYQQPAIQRMDRNLRNRAFHWRTPRPAHPPRQHRRDERRELQAYPEPRPKGRSPNLITHNGIGPAGQCAMARANYLVSARAMAPRALPLAWYCAATWPVFTPPLTPKLDSRGCRGLSDLKAT